MNFVFGKQNNVFVQTVGKLASSESVTDGDLGYAYWQVLSYELFKYVPAYLEQPFCHCYTLASEFDWRYETFFLADVLASTIRLPNGAKVSFRSALEKISPNLVKALILPPTREEWGSKASVLLCAACELSRRSTSKEAPLLTRCFVNANPVFGRFVSV